MAWTAASSRSRSRSGGIGDLAPGDHRPGVDALVDEVNGDAGDLDTRLERLPDRVQAGEGGQQGRVDVDDAVAEAGDEGALRSCM